VEYVNQLSGIVMLTRPQVTRSRPTLIVGTCCTVILNKNTFTQILMDVSNVPVLILTLSVIPVPNPKGIGLATL